ncbi:type I restriction enzyme HsdR N-terminal domain-containing protein [Gallibacterium melopsittaci]|uniref:Type I restriction enzyme HsdR N-terminal domain-containing protein n=1 Tax=Gallibacterium melopsittaci TaxID=516063 RepID=A0ABV6HUX8_9PAST
MLKENNFRDLLVHLNFTEHQDKFSKTINGNELVVDFKNKKIIYPAELKKHRETTLNFSSNENFVVFECIHRLLEKGYPAAHLELEKSWQLGHTQKSGRADICVYQDREKTSLFMIIECKTDGTEYNKALKILKEDGGQLFSYWQQDKKVHCISLYTSDFTDGILTYKNPIIRCHDDANLIQLAKKDDSIKIYQKANNVEELHEVWTETYLQKLSENLIFGQDAQIYDLDLPPLRIKDLKAFSPDDKIINQFEEILRHNAVSDKENAFNRLIALFICKLVDEQKNDDSEVEFQYKIGSDTYETLQDRLQHLYKTGMEKFMKEKIFYVSNDYAQNLFKNLDLETRNHAISDLEQTIRKLKFYSNNDFSFKDVHNEELFLQNGTTF